MQMGKVFLLRIPPMSNQWLQWWQLIARIPPILRLSMVAMLQFSLFLKRLLNLFVEGGIEQVTYILDGRQVSPFDRLNTAY